MLCFQVFMKFPSLSLSTIVSNLGVFSTLISYVATVADGGRSSHQQFSYSEDQVKLLLDLCQNIQIRVTLEKTSTGAFHNNFAT